MQSEIEKLFPGPAVMSNCRRVHFQDPKIPQTVYPGRKRIMFEEFAVTSFRLLSESFRVCAIGNVQRQTCQHPLPGSVVKGKFSGQELAQRTVRHRHCLYHLDWKIG